MSAMAGINLPDRTQTLIPGVHMKLKRALFAAALLALPGIAHAELSFLTSSTTARTEIFNIAGFPNMAVGTLVDLGSLVTSHSGTVTFTYLGQESGYTNSLQFPASGASLFESDAVGTAISAMVNSVGAINFRFTELVSPSSSSAVNGGIWAPNTSIGMIGRNMSVLGNSYDYVLGYNDSAGSASLGDWDDFVVGVNFATQVPEPEVYGMMLAGLGILGWAGRRRKQLVAS